MPLRLRHGRLPQLLARRGNARQRHLPGSRRQRRNALARHQLRAGAVQPRNRKNPHLHTPQRPAWQPVQLPRRPARPRREILVRRIRRHRRFRSRTTPFLAQARTGPLHHGTEHQQRGAERRGRGIAPRPESALHRPHHPRTQPIEHQSPFRRHQFLANRLDRLLLCTRTGRHGVDRRRPVTSDLLRPASAGQLHVPHPGRQPQRRLAKRGTVAEDRHPPSVVGHGAGQDRLPAHRRRRRRRRIPLLPATQTQAVYSNSSGCSRPRRRRSCTEPKSTSSPKSPTRSGRP